MNEFLNLELKIKDDIVNYISEKWTEFQGIKISSKGLVYVNFKTTKKKNQTLTKK